MENKTELPEGWREAQAIGTCHNCGAKLYGHVNVKGDESHSDAYFITICFSHFLYPCPGCQHKVLPTDFCADFVPPPPTEIIWMDNSDEHGVALFPDAPQIVTDESWIGPNGE
jgi:hypothetical protein